MTMESQYLNIMSDILEEGVDQTDRTGTGTKEIWAPTLRCDLADGFPVLTTKKVFLDKVISELCWMIHGHTNVKELHKMGNRIWDAWADDDGELGPVYGAQWRNWHPGRKALPGEPGIDQLGEAIERLKINPH